MALVEEDGLTRVEEDAVRQEKPVEAVVQKVAVDAEEGVNRGFEANIRGKYK